MTPMEAEARRKYPKDHLTDEERRAIDAAVQAGRIQRIPRGVSGIETQLMWDQKANGLRYADTGKPKPKFNGGCTRNRYNDRQAADRQHKLKQAREMHEAGKTQEQIRKALGVGKKTVQEILKEIGKPVSRADAAALGARVKQARKLWADGYDDDMTREQRKALLASIAAKVGRSVDTVRAYIADAQMGA